jgi:uncharacterized membrane protein (UPF0182 family)
MNPVNGFTPEGLPTLILSNMPIQSTVRGLTVTRPEIYFGEMTNTDHETPALRKVPVETLVFN